MTELWSLSASDMAAWIRGGRTTSEDVVRSCLERIAARDGEVEAWEWLDPEAALTMARARDAQGVTGPLHGVPVAIKDIIDTADMPSGYGSPIYKGHRPDRDASCIAILRAAGAVILGKSVTTEFATFQPGKTRNPHDSERTPGGSSSGSAAAVATGMAPLALGTQTVGSIIRPASFCGVVGFKTSQGGLNLDGVKPLTPSLDSLGCFARCVDDLALWYSVAGSEPLPRQQSTMPRIALVRTPHWEEADKASRDAVEDAAARLAAAGAEVIEPILPDAFDRLAAVQDTIFAVGAVAALEREWRDHRDQLSPQLTVVLERGEGITAEELIAAEETARFCRAEVGKLFRRVDLLLSPAARGEAPTGLETTGDPLFNRIWTLLLGPCATLPTHRGPQGMPVGIQLAGERGRDTDFLGALLWTADRLGLGQGVPPV